MDTTEKMSNGEVCAENLGKVKILGAASKVKSPMLPWDCWVCTEIPVGSPCLSEFRGPVQMVQIPGLGELAEFLHDVVLNGFLQFHHGVLHQGMHHDGVPLPVAYGLDLNQLQVMFDTKTFMMIHV